MLALSWPIIAAGASVAPDDESGDAHRFTQGLAALAAARGVQFRFNAGVQRLHRTGDQVDGVDCLVDGRIERLKADAYVVALGSYSPLLLRQLGIGMSVYPAKGYSVTLPVEHPELAYTMSLTDEASKIVFSRLGQRMRVAGTAEFNGYDTSLNAVRCQALTRRLLQLFPGVADAGKAEYWAGLRPSTPSNVPSIGRTRYRNL
jgi:D-amino-acid dehydrogenase